MREQPAGGSLLRTWGLSHAAAAGELTVGLQMRTDFIPELSLHRTAARRRIATVRDDTMSEASAGLFARHARRWTDWLRSEAGLWVDRYHFDVAADDPRNSGRRRAGLVPPQSRPRELALALLNAPDRENYDIAYAFPSRLPGEPASGVDDLHFHPAAPRLLRLALTHRW